MKLDNQILIEKYYNKIKDEYPQLSFDQVKEIVSAPYQYLKEQIQSPELPTIRLKYLGTFVVYEGRAEYILKCTERSYQKGNITKQLYDERTKILTEFLERRRRENQE